MKIDVHFDDLKNKAEIECAQEILAAIRAVYPDAPVITQNVRIPAENVQVPEAAVVAPAAMMTPEAPAPAPAAPTPAAQPAAQPAVPVSTPSYTVDDLARAAAPIMDAGRLDELQALLQKYGVQFLPDLKPEHFGAFATDLRQLGAQI